MSIFNVNWRELYKQVLPPLKRFAQTLDLGQSHLTTFQTDSDTLAAFRDRVDVEKKYNCIKMVMQASFNEFFSETTFVVETETNPIRFAWMGKEIEYAPAYIPKQSGDSDRKFWLAKESEPAANESIIIKVPAGLFSSSLDNVKAFGNKIKVAGKSIKYESL